MFRPQMRRRRRALDTYVHVELEERGSLTENDPVPLRLDTSDVTRQVGLKARSTVRALPASFPPDGLAVGDRPT